MPHIREHGSILASAEKRLLIAIATRLPARVSSDMLSAVSLTSMALAGLSFAAFHRTPRAVIGVVASLFLNWFGDSLDGTVARVRHLERPHYGFYVDHVMDLAGTAFLLGGLACSGLMNPLLALAMLAAFLLVAAESYLAAHATGVFRLSFLGVGPSELRIAMIVAAIRAARSPMIHIADHQWLLFDVAGLAGTIGLAAAFVAAAARNSIVLYDAERVPGVESADFSR